MPKNRAPGATAYSSFGGVPISINIHSAGGQKAPRVQEYRAIILFKAGPVPSGICSRNSPAGTGIRRPLIKPAHFPGSPSFRWKAMTRFPVEVNRVRFARRVGTPRTAEAGKPAVLSWKRVNSGKSNCKNESAIHDQKVKKASQNCSATLFPGVRAGVARRILEFRRPHL